MSRESPAIEVDRSLSGQCVVAVLERLAATHGRPKTIFVDKGPEFTPKALDAWAHRHGVQLAFRRPGTSTDHPFIEAFNARLREECLNQHRFVSMEEAWTTIEA
jgi:putative transposase